MKRKEPSLHRTHRTFCLLCLLCLLCFTFVCFVSVGTVTSSTQCSDGSLSWAARVRRRSEEGRDVLTSLYGSQAPSSPAWLSPSAGVSVGEGELPIHSQADKKGSKAKTERCSWEAESLEGLSKLSCFSSLGAKVALWWSCSIQLWDRWRYVRS